MWRMLRLENVSREYLDDVVKRSGLVCDERFREICERQGASKATASRYSRELHVERTFATDSAMTAAVHGEGAEERVAVVCRSKINIFNVESGERVAQFDQDDSIGGAAFNAEGELYVSNYFQGNVSVYDRAGVLVRKFGSEGSEDGQLCLPQGISFTGEGELLVADSGNDRVQVFGKDGAYLRKIGGFLEPLGVCVAPDGSIVVACWEEVHVLDNEGAFVRYLGSDGFVRYLGSEGTGDGHFHFPQGVAAGPRGEILVADSERKDIQVFRRDGVLLQRIGADGDSKVDLGSVKSVCVDGEGRVFVSSNGSLLMLS